MLIAGSLATLPRDMAAGLGKIGIVKSAVECRWAARWRNAGSPCCDRLDDFTIIVHIAKLGSVIFTATGTRQRHQYSVAPVPTEVQGLTVVARLVPPQACICLHTCSGRLCTALSTTGCVTTATTTLFPVIYDARV